MSKTRFYLYIHKDRVLELCQNLVEESYLPYTQKLDDSIAYLPEMMMLVHQLPRHLYRFSDTLEVFLDTCDAYGSLPLNDFLYELRQALMNDTYRRRMAVVKYEANQNLVDMKAYIKDMFENWSRLVVIRIDLHYHQDIDIDVSYERLKQDLKTLYSNARHNAIFAHQCGYIIKIEYGLKKGAHAHAMLFFDGNKRLGTSDIYLAQQIGEYWRDTITHGHGTYWNCNADADSYVRNGIGLVLHNDDEKRENLNMAVAYLCKKEKQMIKPHSSIRARTLMRGDLRNDNPNLGRPRING